VVDLGMAITMKRDDSLRLKLAWQARHSDWSFQGSFRDIRTASRRGRRLVLYSTAVSRDSYWYEAAKGNERAV
jgi:hypothetical protein